MLSLRINNENMLVCTQSCGNSDQLGNWISAGTIRVWGRTWYDSIWNVFRTKLSLGRVGTAICTRCYRHTDFIGNKEIVEFSKWISVIISAFSQYLNVLLAGMWYRSIDNIRNPHCKNYIFLIIGNNVGKESKDFPFNPNSRCWNSSLLNSISAHDGTSSW